MDATEPPARRLIAPPSPRAEARATRPRGVSRETEPVKTSPQSEDGSAGQHVGDRMSAERGLAFGVDPHRSERYSLRQSRYDAAAQDISSWAGAAERAGHKLAVLDVGCGSGSLLRHLEAKPHFEAITLSATNFYEKSTYKPHAYHDYIICDLTKPCPELRSSAYDVVICEQVLEHLSDVHSALATLVRVTKPGGRVIIGVPIHAPPLHLARLHLVPVLDRLAGRTQSRGHVQAFSLFSFRRLLRSYPALELREQRGFRIISGGVLRPLENLHWYWRTNRWLGTRLQAICPEVQFLLEKAPPTASRLQ
ncbi:MAG: class I SAM-dependent methyltransferase [Alphaproteobacteria bacterium]|nr:class I SAM-dependent methyltransferase [Alphaproteobacteria bacterium]